ncbi:LAFA_0E17436g1_1 [Lachancea sp. 'fantastica']|nr:LAFA_0E17436g1_1 [Lachancea sp. 'fantastica']
MSFAGDVDRDFRGISAGMQQVSLRQINPNHRHRTRRLQPQEQKTLKSDKESPSSGVFVDVHSHLAVLKNENYHLKMELIQQQQEVNQLMKQLKNAEKSAAELPSYREIATGSEKPLLNYAAEVSDENESPSKSERLSVSDYDIVTHFSGSPYRGEPMNSEQDITSRPDSSMTHIRRNGKFFKNSVIPFLHKTLDTFQHSEVFREDAKCLQGKLEAFKAHTSADKELRVQLMIHLLDGINHLQQQCVALLNRELENKRVSRQLEYLFSALSDPEHHGLVGKESGTKLKAELLDAMLDILAPENERARQHGGYSKSEQSSKSGRMSKREPTINTPAVNKIIKSQLDVVPSMPPLPKLSRGCSRTGSDMSEPPKVSYLPPKTSSSSSPSLSLSNLPVRSHRKADIHGRLHHVQGGRKSEKEARSEQNHWEFIPIGYDDSMLSKQTPSRRLAFNIKRDEILQRTPLAITFKDDGEAEGDSDPLQAYFTEFSGDTLDQDESTNDCNPLKR